MSLIANTPLESARRKFFISWTYIMSTKQESLVFGLRMQKMSLTAISLLESARKNFSCTRRTSCLQSWNQLFLGSGCQNESNSHQLARIGEKKIFHELDVHDV